MLPPWVVFGALLVCAVTLTVLVRRQPPFALHRLWIPFSLALGGTVALGISWHWLETCPIHPPTLASVALGTLFWSGAFAAVTGSFSFIACEITRRAPQTSFIAILLAGGLAGILAAVTLSSVLVLLG